MLAHTLVTAPAATPTRWLLVLHGLLGRGSNWRSLTRALVEARPHWGGVLVDVRMHGDSQGFAPPHSVASAAEDLDVLARALPGPVEGVLGHSLGGKIALAWAAGARGLRHLLLLDTNPGPRPDGGGSETTAQVLSVLRKLQAPFASRESFVAQVETAGVAPAVARWLAQNLVAAPGGFTFALDLQAMHSLFSDVLHRDDWPLLSAPPPGLQVDVILGGHSTTVDAEARRRLEGLARAGLLRLTVLPEAGHWVQVDDAQGTLRAVTQALG
jgi:esterase